MSARNRSNASAPRPSQSGRYADTNGTTASIHRIGAKPSITVDATCTATKATAISERFLCRPCVTKRGHRGEAHCIAPARPSSATPVSSSSETTPVARVRYHMALPEVRPRIVTFTLPPAASRRREQRRPRA
jgi:hypothetical protein